MEQALSGTVDAKLPRIPPIAEPLPADAVDDRPERAMGLQLFGLGREHRQAGVTSHLCCRLDQSRLADPRLALHHHEPAPARQAANDLLQRGQLDPAPHQRRLRNRSTQHLSTASDLSRPADPATRRDWHPAPILNP